VSWAYLRWRWSHRTFWFQRRCPHHESPTRCYEGKPGEGKTLLATRDAIAYMRQGVDVWANYKIRDPVSGQEAKRLTSWRELVTVSVAALGVGRPTIFVIDEVHMWCDSRLWQKAPGWWKAIMSQRRHFGVGIICTTQSLKRVDVILRDLCDELVRVRKRFIWRLPLMQMECVAPESVEADYRLSDPVWFMPKWWAFHGYTTVEFQPVQEWSVDDAKMDEELQELFDLAMRVTRAKAVLPAFVDAIEEDCASQTG
jgi:hypothetical protein